MGLKLIGEVALDGSGFERGLNRLGRTAAGSVKTAIAGLFGTFAISQAVKGTIEWASKLQDSADALGVNVEWLQKMQNGAKLVGGDIEDITKTILEMNKSRQDALINPKGKNAQALGRLGATQADISSLSTKDFFDKIVAAFKNGATTQLANDVQEVGGRSARNLIGAFANQFANDMPILSQEMINQLDDIGDEFTALSRTLTVALAPAILFVAQGLVKLINKLKEIGAFLGAISPKEVAKGLNENKKDILLANAALGPFGMLIKAVQAGLGGSESGGSAALEEVERQEKSQAAIDAGKGSTRAARKRREGAAPQFEDIIPKKQPLSKEDALVRVGNFLGTSKDAIANLQQKQVNLLTQIERNTRARQASSGDVFGGVNFA